jgi:glycerophosphoryl diester phosphodiesterase
VEADARRGRRDGIHVARRPLTVGHRGASALAPENTLRAVELAIAYGLDFVEVDVHLSRDRELVVIHDDDLQRTHGRRERVAELTAAELAPLDVPRLRDVFALARGRIGVYVELKGERTGAALTDFFASGAARGVQVVVGSFEPALLAELRAEAPKSVLFEATSAKRMVAQCRRLDATYAHPCFRPLTAAIVHQLHLAGLRVMAPHTNDLAEAKQFAEIGIDVIATDDPRLLR